MANRWKERWERWDIRVVILASLFLQIFLIFSAPLRKRMSKAYIIFPMWLFYLLADATANFAVGLISKSQNKSTPSGPSSDPNLLAFWAPFLLVHLGGPDTITAFALEDNELWLRHLLGLLFQCWAVGYAFSQSFPNHFLYIPTIIMFIAGLIKYTERTRALYLASSRRFRDSLLGEPDPGPNYAKLMDEYSSKKEARLPTRIEMLQEPDRKEKKETEEQELKDLEIVREAFDLFQTFRGLIADLIFSFRERTETRDKFLRRTARDAFKVVEVELNFFYEVLYTKAEVVQGRLGLPLRLASFTLNCVALGLFIIYDKKKIKNFDLGVTYTLLAGAIALDVVAFLMVLYSDWTAAYLTENEIGFTFINKLKRFFERVLNVGRTRWPKEEAEPCWIPPFGWLMKNIVRKRWSENMSQYNLIDYCLHPRSTWWETILKWFGLTSLLDGLKYVETINFTPKLRDLIFSELRMKSEMADDLETAKEIFEARGDWVLRFDDCTGLLPWTNNLDYDEILILWHVATDLCFFRDEAEKNRKELQDSKDAVYILALLSKQLSDYMLYMLIMQATMMSTVVGIGQIRFRDTCAEAKKFFRKRNNLAEEKKFWESFCFCGLGSGDCFFAKEVPLSEEENKNLNRFKEQNHTCCCGLKKCCCKGTPPEDRLRHEMACCRILYIQTVVEPVAVKGDRSKSVLFEACRLAKELNKMEKRRKWEIISKVWVELMCYAAGRCRPNAHAAQLSKGGQLISLIWLLMTNFGLGNQYQIRAGHRRAKLIVGK
ncbi:hypothetical protein NMG60_11022357 [Bertholletia excelsa]